MGLRANDLSKLMRGTPTWPIRYLAAVQLPGAKDVVLWVRGLSCIELNYYKGIKEETNGPQKSITIRTFLPPRNETEHQPYLKSDSSSVVARLIIAQRQSMLELDRARPMHFLTM